MSEQSSSDLGAFLAGFVIGGLVGAATAIILAPQSGQETRAQIATKGSDFIHAGEEQVLHYREAANTYAQDYQGKASGMAAATREQMHSATGLVQEQARIVLDRGNSEPSSANDSAAEQPANEDTNNGASVSDEDEETS